MANDLITWDRLLSLDNDGDVREAIKLLKEIGKVYDKLIKDSNQLKTKHNKNLKAVIDQTKKLSQEYSKLNPVTEKGKQEIVEMASKAELLSGTFNGLKGKVVALEGSTKKLNTEKKKVAESTKKLIALENEEAKLKNKLIQMETKQGQSVQKLRVQIQEKNKQMKLAARESLGLITLYQKESKQLIELRNKYKNVALQYGINSREAKKLERQVAQLDKRLKTVDSRVGQHQRSVGNYGKAWSGVAGTLRNVAGALGFAGVVFGLVSVFRNATRTLFEFDQEMVNLAAISGETREDLIGLESEIRRVAKTSINTATDVAKTATALKTLGQSNEEIIDLLEPVNNLSIALRAPADAAGELLVKTLNAFGESAEAGQRYADVIAKMRTSTALDFQRISDSLAFLAPTANAVGLSIERTGAILGVLVDNGIRAARAGRLMSSSFAGLADQGLTLEEALDLINNSSDKTTEALRLFGKESFSLALILAANTDKVEEYDQAFQEAGGTLEELTEKQLVALTNKTKILNSAWQELILSIESGEGALGQFIGGLIDGLSDIITLITAAQNGTIGWGEALSSLQSPLTMVATLTKIRAIEAGKAAEEERRLASIRTQAEHLYQEALENGITTFGEYEKRIGKALDQNINKTEVLAEIQKLFNKEVEDDIDNEVVAREGIIEGINEEIKALRKKRELSTSEDEIEALNIQIRAYENGLKKLNDLGGGFEKLKKKGVKPVIPELKLIPKELENIEKSGDRMFTRIGVLFENIKGFFEDFGREISTSFINTFNALDGFLRAREEKAIMALESRLDNIEQRRQRELQIVGDNEEAKAAIEDRYNKQREQVEARIRKERTKAARREKAVTLAQALINGAAAVVQALPNIPLSILIGSLAAAQVAFIASTPVPEYYKGTPPGGHIGGPAWVGERGREIIKEPNKRPYLQDRKAKVNLPTGTHVYKNSVTERILSKVDNPDTVASNNSVASDVRESVRKEREQALRNVITPSIRSQSQDMAKSFKESIDDLEIHQWKMGERGFQRNVRKGNTTYIDVKNENRHGG